MLASSWITDTNDPFYTFSKHLQSSNTPTDLIRPWRSTHIAEVKINLLRLGWCGESRFFENAASKNIPKSLAFCDDPLEENLDFSVIKKKNWKYQWLSTFVLSLYLKFFVIQMLEVIVDLIAFYEGLRIAGLVCHEMPNLLVT
jgi:hypothetical protein